MNGCNRWREKLGQIGLRLWETSAVQKTFGLLPAGLREKLVEMARKGTLQEIVRYGFWGVATTLFNFFSYWGMLALRVDYRAANLISMVLTKCAAYLANKYFVFRSKRETKRALVGEMTRFVVTRVLSGVVEFVGLMILVDLLNMGRLPGKAVMLVIVMVLNYLFGKLVVYKA